MNPTTMVKKEKEFEAVFIKEMKVEDLEIKKMKQGMSYSCKEKTIILNVFKYFRSQHPDKCVTDLVRRTAKATGCSEKSVFQFRKEEASVEGFKQPSKTKIRRNININSRDIKYDNTVRTNIRNIIYDLQYKNIVPSLNTILKQIKADKDMPKFSLMTLRRLMFDMGFSYQKNGNKCVLVEKPDNRLTNLRTQNNMNSLQPKPIQTQDPLPIAPDISHMHAMNKQPANIIPNSDPRLTAVMHKPLHVPSLPSVPPQHDPTMMGPPPPPDMMHSHPHTMLHKSMPMMINPRRDMMPPPPPQTMTANMNMQMKRDSLPWMHGILKQDH